MSRCSAILCAALAASCCAWTGCAGGQPGKQAPPEPGAPKAAAGAKKEAAVDAAAVTATPRAPMIVYTHTLDVVVSDLDAATAEVERLVDAHKGYVAKSEVRSDAGSRRSAAYQLRIPAAADRQVRSALLALGVPERNASDAQDVGEEFVDVEKRIQNLKELEGKLNELLREKRKDEKLEEVKGVMREVAQVRGDIERAQGRREYLLNRTAFSTTDLTLREVKDYKPPIAPTFAARVGDTFRGSWDGLLDFGAGAALVAVALVPWAPVWGPALAVGVWATRRTRAARTGEPRPAPPADAANAEQPRTDPPTPPAG